MRGNQVPYMTKNLRETIIIRSQFKTKHFKINIAENLPLYIKQKNWYK